MEVKEVSAIFEKKLVLTGQQATKISVKSQGPQYDMILLSTHGEMIESDPLKSNLRFTPSEKDDGRLTVSEIFDMEIKANLVTLSACETALVRGETGDFPQGDDLVGLSRAFIHAGAPSVVASLWKVSDDSTVELMGAFYRNLKSMSKSEALRKAQLDLMKSSIRFPCGEGSGGITQSIRLSARDVDRMLPSLLLGALYPVRGLEIIFKTNNSCHFLTACCLRSLPSGPWFRNPPHDSFPIRGLLLS